MYGRNVAPFLEPSFSVPVSWDLPGRRPELGLLKGQGVGPGAEHEGRQREGSGPRNQTQERMAGYTVITPDEVRRDKLTRIAKKELEDLEKWRQKQRSKPIHTKPNKLGGNQSEAEVRKKQQSQLLQFKYQQKLKREDSLRIQKEMEEAKFKAVKAIQREKSHKLEEKRRLQEKQRKEAFNDPPPCKFSEILSGLEPKVLPRSSHPTSHSDPMWKLPALPKEHSLDKNEVPKTALKEQENWKLYKMKDEQRKKGDLLEVKRQWQEEERTKARQHDQRRVNNAFLDRIQGKSQAGGLQSGGFGNMNCGRGWGV